MSLSRSLLRRAVAPLLAFGLGILVRDLCITPEQRPLAGLTHVHALAGPSVATREKSPTLGEPPKEVSQGSALELQAKPTEPYGVQGSVEEARAALIQDLRHQIRLATARARATENDKPVDLISDYLAGVGAAVQAMGPEVAQQMREHIETTLCSDQADSHEGAAFLRMAARQPDLATSKGLACLLESPGEVEEDSMLWDALDTWHAKKLGWSDSLAQLQEGATNVETKARLRALELGQPLTPILLEMSGSKEAADKLRADLPAEVRALLGR